MSPPLFEIVAPDLGPWRAGNTGVEGVWRFESGQPGRDVLVTSLIHGNELCGAWALHDALQQGLRPRRGSLTLVFANLAAFDRFDPMQPHASRYVDADLNRLWGRMPWRSDGSQLGVEHRRVIELLPVVERCDWLLDLHSMHEPGPALGLVGPYAHHAARAQQLGAPALLVADAGHSAGCRLRDHERWGDADDSDAFALLVECGFHGAAASRSVAQELFARFTVASGCVDPGDLPAWQTTATAGPQRLLQVTDTITVAPGEPPRFAQAWECGQRIERAGTLLGWNGGKAFATPRDGCVLVMPTLLHAIPGATLVRLAREVDGLHRD